MDRSVAELAALFEERLGLGEGLPALGELPDSWRAAVQLVDVEGMSYDEAAASLDVARDPRYLDEAYEDARLEVEAILRNASLTRGDGVF